MQSLQTLFWNILVVFIIGKYLNYNNYGIDKVFSHLWGWDDVCCKKIRLKDVI